MTFGQRIGILGGTFDPVHYGHLVMAENAMQDLGLSSVIFAPAGTPPHKPGVRLSSTEDRLAMVSLAIEGRENFHVSRIDIDDVEISYTWRLLERFRTSHPDADLWFIMGGDSLEDFPQWKNPQAILNVSRLAVIERPGYVSPPERPDLPPFVMDRVDLVEAPLCQVSSTDIRKRIISGRSIRYLVPDRVRGFILQRDLYRDNARDE